MEFKELVRRQIQMIEELMVLIQGFNNNISIESGTFDIGGGTEFMVGWDDLLEIVFGFENEMCVTFSLTAARKNEDKGQEQMQLEMLLLEIF